jgi:predicted AAA+ superfamily ATPase
MVTIEQLIQEWQSRPMPEASFRDASIQLDGHLVPAVIGMRRSGKTWRLFQEIRHLVDTGTELSNILYMNFDDDRLLDTRLGGPAFLNNLLETFFRLNPVARKTGAWFFFDEIQEIPGWASFARRIIDTENIHLVVTGSSAKLLSSEIATEFRGRSLPIELLPFSFREYLHFYDFSVLPSTLERSHLANAFDTYLEKGGFPEAFPQKEPLVRLSLLQNYVDMVVLRDTLERYGLGNARGVSELAHTLIASNGNLVSLNRLSNQLAGRSIKMSREMCGTVCEHLNDAFLVFFVPLYTPSLQKMRVNPQKVYAIDPGLAFAFTPPSVKNIGQRLEQTVYLELRRRYPLLRNGGISYYLTNERHEVDFVLGDPGQGSAQGLFQVCASFEDDATKQRELSALQDAMNELGLKEGTVITLYESGTLQTAAGTITIVPSWRWFLE